MFSIIIKFYFFWKMCVLLELPGKEYPEETLLHWVWPIPLSENMNKEINTSYR